MRTNVFNRIAVAIVFSLLLTACGGAAGGPSAADLAATQQSLEATQQALNAQPAQPSNTPEPPTAEPATEELTAQQAATEAPTETLLATSPDFYTEEFDISPGDWTYFTYEGSSNSNPGTDFEVYTQGGRLVFDIPDENVWIYYGPDSWSYTDVRIDARAENLGANNNRITLWCRYSDRGWYEFNVGNNGLYEIVRYDSDTDTYNNLYTGGVQNLKTGKATNEFTAICEGDSLTLGVNGTEIRTVTDSRFDEGLIGVGVSSFTGVPVLVEFEWVSITPP